MSTRQSYDHELASLRQDILAMGEQVAIAIDGAVNSLKTQDIELARKVIDGDDAIDNAEVVIEDKCMLLIAKQQPLARDLRIVSTGLKIATDLERIGDHAYEIAQVTLKLSTQPLLKPLIDIPRMAGMAQQMLHDSLDAYTRIDTTLADRVCALGAEVEQLHQQLFRELLTYMMEDPRTISQATLLIFVSRYLDRIAAHATNIAEWVIFLETGQRIRKGN